ncbi:family 16 glycosylhydrolase [Aureimonas sp. AU40]|uniref:family 16 glycosylhydrolase n=1 Tax=Aureimonas sp. AU40 TaxID=1637747 RepID=UPI0007860CE8|nr:family 16 glycosylhydrolase [Aureimonas sp. AU40]
MALQDFFGNPVKLSGGYVKAGNAYTSSKLVNGTATGTDENDGFTVGVGNYTLIGGNGDDRYYQVQTGTKIVEKAGGGIDSVYLSGSFVMPDHVENAFVGYADGVFGNSLANYIVGNAKSQIINGGAGNDVLTGGGGGDIFDFSAKSGYDVITDFHPGKTSSPSILPDTIRLSGYDFTSFSQVKAAMTQVGNDVVLKMSATDSVKILDTKVADFSADNFHLKLDTSQFKQTFNEDFNSLNLSNGQNGGTWRTDYGWGGDRNGVAARTLPANSEKQLYVDTSMVDKYGKSVSIDPFKVKDGVLTIHADKTPDAKLGALYGYQYTSGLLTTRDSFAQTYGYFEARMDVPAGQGVWPAFWLYTTSKSGSELDVMESHGTDLWTATTHDHSTGKDNQLSSTIFTPDLTTGYHTYGVLWTASQVTWYLDGTAVKSVATPADMHGPMYMLVNLAIDKTADASTFNGADLKVDYIRAYSLANSPLASVPTNSLVATPAKPAFQALVGTARDDTFVVTHSGDTILEKAGGGTDTVHTSVDYTLPDNVENVVLLSGALKVVGNDEANRMFGNAEANMLIGGAGNDTLIGQGGADTMIGGTGDDYYDVDNAGDLVVEKPGEGRDTVAASIDYILPDNVENLTLTGSALRGTGNALDNTLLGNAMNNTLWGGAGNDVLDGGAGADTMAGGTGNDTYYVDNAGDKVVEAAGEGSDCINSSVDYTLPDNVEKLVLTGSALRATGNDLDNVLHGNALDNILIGGGGNDQLDGKAGADTMIGGTGDDIYYVDNPLDLVIERPGEGRDTVISSIDITLPANVEQLILTGSAVRGTAGDTAASLYGNAVGNVLTGGAGNDIIDGKAGDDTIRGGGGNDWLTGGSGRDLFVFGPGGGADTITDFNAAEDRVDWSAYGHHGQLPAMVQSGSSVVVFFDGGDKVTFLNETVKDLTDHHVFG